MTISHPIRLLAQFRRVALLLAAVVMLAACASQDNRLPFENTSGQGTDFWMISPLTEEATFAFHWGGSTLRLVRSGNGGLQMHEIDPESCALLEPYLILFDQSMLDTVNIVFLRKPPLPSRKIVLDGSHYRARYFSKQFGTAVELSGSESKQIPWVAAAMKVRDRAFDCIDNPGVRGNPPKTASRPVSGQYIAGHASGR